MLPADARSAPAMHISVEDFPAPEGRLKLRDFGNETAELIAYRRPDTSEAVSRKPSLPTRCAATTPVPSKEAV